MKTYTTLEELYQDALPAQLTAQNILNGRGILHGTYQDFQVSPELREQVVDKLTDSIGGRGDTPNRVRRSLAWERPQHWGLERFYLEKFGDSPTWIAYCAGQDHISEMREIRNYLKH